MLMYVADLWKDRSRQLELSLHRWIHHCTSDHGCTALQFTEGGVVTLEHLLRLEDVSHQQCGQSMPKLSTGTTTRDADMWCGIVISTCAIPNSYDLQQTQVQRDYTAYVKQGV